MLLMPTCELCNTTLNSITTDPGIQRQECMIPICNKPDHEDNLTIECKIDRGGTTYQGKINRAANGYMCTPWHLIQ